MNIAGLRSIGFAILLVLLAGASCNRPKRASSESSAAPTPHGIRAPITAHAPDAFYDAFPQITMEGGFMISDFQSPDNNLESVFRYLVGG